MEENNINQPVGKDQLRRFLEILERYKAGKSHTESRIISSENWWKLRSAGSEGKQSVSGWLHNVIVSKHADAMESFPEPNILPREASDRREAAMLSAVIPCVLEQNHFESTFSDVAWQKLKTGTGVYKVVWDSGKLGGLGDISVERVNLLNIYWEPGLTDIQKSRFFFHTELWNREVLEGMYPQLKGKNLGQSFVNARFLYDDAVSTQDSCTVIEVYYHRGNTLQYCKFVGDQVLYATENDPVLSQRGLYDHGLYPYVFDALFPIEGSPCGYGFVDICRHPQQAIDQLMTAFVENAMQGASPRYFSRKDGNINEEEFLDVQKRIVHVSGNVDEASIRRIDHASLDGMYVNVYDRIIQELRQTSGNTESATGTSVSGVTAASAIAALQEAAGKGSKDATRSAYRAFSQVVELCVELIRQFYDLPRQFRITGNQGQEEFVSFDNRGLKPQYQGMLLGQDLGYRKPVFDIKVSAQRKSVYTKVTQNELALQFFKLGFFEPGMASKAMACLEMMDFDGKDQLMQNLRRHASDAERLRNYMLLALQLAEKYEPELAQGLEADLRQSWGEAVSGDAMPTLRQADAITGAVKKEHGLVRKARQNAADAARV